MRTLVVSLLSVFFLFSGAVKASETADAPQFKVGDSWKMSLSNSLTKKELDKWDELVTKIEDEKVFLKVGSCCSMTLTLEGNRVSFLNLKNNSEQIYDPFVKNLSFPLSVGQTWKAPYRAKINRNITLEGELEVKVTSFEKKEVPAGIFDTFKVESVTNFVGNGPWGTYQGKYVYTYWYAPQVKRQVASEFVKYVNGRADVNETMTLLRFSLAE